MVSHLFNENMVSKGKNYCPLTDVIKIEECGSDWGIKCTKLPTSYELFYDMFFILIHFQTLNCPKEPSNIC